MKRSTFGVLCILSIAVFAWCGWWNVIGRVVIADGNLDTWLHHLDAEQREGIDSSMDFVAWGIIVPLAAMQIFWAIVVGTQIWRRPKA